MNGERKREVTGGETEKCRGGMEVGWRGGCDRRKRLPTVYIYIMQMVPIISEVYNRSINLLTGKKGSGKRGTSPAGVVPYYHRYLSRQHRKHLLTSGHTPP